MADKSKIEWTDATWNPIRGCSRVSEGCRNCYAERVAARFAGPGQPYEGVAHPITSVGYPHWTGGILYVPELLGQPLYWKRPRKIFVNSMSDLFHEHVNPAVIDKIFAVMALCPRHTFQILTKRPEVMQRYLQDRMQHPRVLGIAWEMLGRMPKYKHEGVMEQVWPLSNVWLGVSVEDQKTADERIPLLLQTPAAVRWVSYEPALGPVDFRKWLRIMWQCSKCRAFFPDPYQKICPACGIEAYWTGSHPFNAKHAQCGSGLDWIVAGGESGPEARPTHPNWFRPVRDLCGVANVPFFFKQWGEWISVAQWFQASERIDRTWQGKILDGVTMLRVGKKRAGHLLDGKVWQEFPNHRGRA